MTEMALSTCKKHEKDHIRQFNIFYDWQFTLFVHKSMSRLGSFESSWTRKTFDFNSHHMRVKVYYYYYYLVTYLYDESLL